MRFGALVAKPPLLYSYDGNSTLVADDDEEKLRAGLLAAFGALNGLSRQDGMTQRVNPDNLDRYQQFITQRIIKILGVSTVEKFWGIQIEQRQQHAEPSPGPHEVHAEPEGEM